MRRDFKYLTSLLVLSGLLFCKAAFPHNLEVATSEWHVSRTDVNTVMIFNSYLWHLYVTNSTTDIISNSYVMAYALFSGPGGKAYREVEVPVQSYFRQNILVSINGDPQVFMLRSARFQNSPDTGQREIVLSFSLEKKNISQPIGHVKITWTAFKQYSMRNFADILSWPDKKIENRWVFNPFNPQSTTWEGDFTWTNEYHAPVGKLPPIPSIQPHRETKIPLLPSTQKAGILNGPNQIKLGPGAGASAPSHLQKRSRPHSPSYVVQVILLGITHVLTGYDHILFLISLVIIGLKLKRLLLVITSFTLAHSLTLFLSAANVFALNPRFVEIMIAFSICYCCVDNIFFQKAQYRWMVASGFGLIHGFGFASALHDTVLTKSNLLLTVFSFNIGVEMGQLTIFLLLLPVLFLLRKKFDHRRIVLVASSLIFLLGITWMIERILNVRILWF